MELRAAGRLRSMSPLALMLTFNSESYLFALRMALAAGLPRDEAISAIVTTIRQAARLVEVEGTQQ